MHVHHGQHLHHGSISARTFSARDLSSNQSPQESARQSAYTSAGDRTVSRGHTGDLLCSAGSSQEPTPVSSARRAEMDPTYGSVQASQIIEENDSSNDSMEFMKREAKADVFDTYAISSALLTSFCVCTIYIERGYINSRTDPIRFWALCLHQFLVRLCTALSLFSMLIFSLSTMYAKTALARQNYAFEVYDEFNKRTGRSRQIAFWCMYSSCLLYSVAVGLGFYYSMNDTMALFGCIGILLLVVVMIHYSEELLDAAGMLFAPDDVVKAMLLKEAEQHAAGA